jgi:hypothetical protein
MASLEFKAMIQATVADMANYPRHPATTTICFAEEADIAVVGFERNIPDSSDARGLYGQAIDRIVVFEGTTRRQVAQRTFWWEPGKSAGRMFPVSVADDGSTLTYSVREDGEEEGKVFACDVKG